MAEVKVVIGEKSGKTYQKILATHETLVGRKIGEIIKGDLIGFNGYEFIVTGGSDHCGTPMRVGIKGYKRTKILANSGTGIKVKEKGKFIRKTVAGDTIGDKTTQVNVKVAKEGGKKLEEIFIEPKEAKAGDKKN